MALEVAIFFACYRGHLGPPEPKSEKKKTQGFPTLSFLSLFFLKKKARKTHQKNKDFYPYRTPKIPGKEGKNARKNKEVLAEEQKNKEFPPKNKERKDRAGPQGSKRSKKESKRVKKSPKLTIFCTLWTLFDSYSTFLGIRQKGRVQKGLEETWT